MEKRTLIRHSVLIGITSAAILLLQINLTRLFAFLLFHHLVTLAVSIPFVGLGAAGSALSVRSLRDRMGTKSFESWLLGQVIAFSISLGVGLFVATSLPMNLLSMSKPVEILKIAVFIIALTIPFYFAGMIICAILSVAGKDTGKIYAADLIGAVVGCVAVFPFIDLIGSEATAYFVAGALPLLFWIVTRKQSQATLQAVALGTAAACFVASLILGGPFSIRTILPGTHKPLHLVELMGPRCEKYKKKYPVLDCDRHLAIDFSKWHYVARIDVLNPGVDPIGFGGGLGAAYPSKNLPGSFKMRSILQDGSAPTYLLDLQSTKLSDHVWAEHILQSAPYQIRKSPDVAIVGVGGGPDIVMALYNNAKSIVGVEINPVTASLLTRVFADYSGRIAFDPKVKIINREGRNFFTLTQDKFDIVHLSGVDTFTASSSGSMAASENYLYTVESLREMYHHLKPGGVVSITRFRFAPDREALRLANSVVEALEKDGLSPEEARSRLAVLGHAPGVNSWCVVMMKESPFTIEERQKIEAFSASEGFELLYLHGSNKVLRTEYLDILDAQDRHAATDDYFFDIRPTTDDWPYFFNYYRWDRLFGQQHGQAPTEMIAKPLGYLLALITTAIVAVIAFVLIWMPLRRKTVVKALESRGLFLLFFIGIACGFIFIELALVQRLVVFLGNPTQALSVVLSTLLLATGTGSFVTSRFTDRAPRVLWIAVLAVIGIGLFEYFVGFRWFFLTQLRLPDGLRIASAIAFIFPLGFFMGWIFPLGLATFCAGHEEHVPYAWAINTSLSVVGSNLSLIVGTFTGVSALLLIGLFFYGFCLWSAWLKRTA